MHTLRYFATDCAHERNSVGRQIAILRAENYYAAANNYSGRRSRRKVQSVIRSLPRNAAMRSHHCSELLKRSFVRLWAFVSRALKTRNRQNFFLSLITLYQLRRESRSLSVTTCIFKKKIMSFSENYKFFEQ